MKDKTIGIITNINENDIIRFNKNKSDDLIMSNVIEKTSCDYSWINIVDECLPYLDAIIQNPRRFLMQEEEVIPVEKTKKVSQASIKHLAEHTNFIQDVEEDGFVRPEKLLNVYKEETYDIYENRFIFTLITRLYEFLDRQNDVHVTPMKKTNKKMIYKSKTVLDNKNINIDMTVSSDLEENDLNPKKVDSIIEKKLFLFELVENIYNCPFMKMLAQATPVKSPIKKTNAILKDQNFKKALELWDYLDKVENEELVKTETEKVDIDSNFYSDLFNFTSFYNYYLTETDINVLKKSTNQDKLDIDKLIEEYVYSTDIASKDFKIKVNSILIKVDQKRKKEFEEIKELFDVFIQNENQRIKKAIDIIK